MESGANHLKSSAVASLYGFLSLTESVIGWIASRPYSGSAIPVTAERLDVLENFFEPRNVKNGKREQIVAYHDIKKQFCLLNLPRGRYQKKDHPRRQENRGIAGKIKAIHTFLVPT